MDKARHVEDHDLGVACLGGEQFFQLVDRTEEQRAVELPCRNAHCAVGVDEAWLQRFLVEGHALDARQFGHAVDEEQAGQDHSKLDCDGQVEQHRDEEGGEQDDAVVVRVATQLGELVPFPHVDRDNHDDGRQGRERHIGGERRGDEHDGEQYQCVEDAGDWRSTAGFYIGGRAGDGAGRRKSAEEGRREVGHALRDQLLVRVMAVVDLAVGDARREQRLDRAEQRDGDGRRDQLAEIVDRQWRDAERRQLLRDAVESAADGFHRQFEDPGHERSCDEDSERPRCPAQQGQALRQAIVGEQEGQAADGEPQCRQVDGVRIGGQSLDAGEEFGRQAVDPEAEEILDLCHEDYDGNAVGETDHDGHRDEADQLPHAGKAHRQQEGPGEHGGAEQVYEAVRGNDAIDDRNEGAGGSADLHARTAEEGSQQPGDDRGPDPCGR